MYTHLQLRDSTRPPVSLATLHKMKAEGEKIASLTCYDASFAALVDEADADIVLVGDSLGMVMQGGPIRFWLRSLIWSITAGAWPGACNRPC